MPVVTLKANGEFALLPQTAVSDYTPTQAMTAQLGNDLVDIVIEVMGHYGLRLTTSEALVQHVAFVPADVNAPPFWIIVSPMWRWRLWLKRKRIRQEFKTKLLAYFYRHPDFWRTFDFDLRFDFGCGTSVVDGQTVAEW